MNIIRRNFKLKASGRINPFRGSVKLTMAQNRIAQLQQLLKKANENDEKLSLLEGFMVKLETAAPAPAVAVEKKGAPKAARQKPLVLKYSNSEGNGCYSIMALLAQVGNYKSQVKALASYNNSIPSVFDPNSGQTVTGEDNCLKFLGRRFEITPCDDMSSIACEALVSKSLTYFKYGKFLEDLNDWILLRTFAVGYSFTTADIALWSALRGNDAFEKQKSKLKNLTRYFNFVNSRYASTVQCKKEKAADTKSEKKKKGKSVQKKKEQKDIASIYKVDKNFKGTVVTRFPPEPSGFLHIGHCKALMLNNAVAEENNGKILLRFDDTNPEKEEADFETAISKDIKMLGIKPAQISHTSDHFQELMERCEALIKKGYFYVDCQCQEDIKKERMAKQESPFRNTSVAENLANWEKMKKGELGMVVRAKMDPASNNGTLRDPSMYRVNLKAEHHRTLDKFKVYPSYDFACPIVDTIEGVSHAMRSKEYNERDDQYSQLWAMIFEGEEEKYKEPSIFQFSRLDFVRTELSKRKLARMIDMGIVNGWDDPRVPTVQGVLRRGMTPAGIKAFIKSQGGTVKDNRQEWDKIWAFNKYEINPIAGRYFSVDVEDAVPMTLEGAPEEGLRSVDLIPAKINPNAGKKLLQLSNRVLLDIGEAEDLKVGQKVTLMHFGGNCEILEINQKNGKVVSVRAKYLSQDTNFKKTPKLLWVADTCDKVQLELVELDYLFTCDSLPKDEPWEKYLTPKTWLSRSSFGECSMRLLKKGEHVQLTKLGFWIVDKAYVNEQNAVRLIYVPDGQTKAASALAEKKSLVKKSNK